MKLRLDIESLRAMKAVASTGSVTRAAVKLNLTQSAVSHKIKRLEERIGRPVFVRTDGSLGVTEDGARLLNYAERLLLSVVDHRSPGRHGALPQCGARMPERRRRHECGAQWPRPGS
jgi:molybdate transport repressor ModE-like protein